MTPTEFFNEHGFVKIDKLLDSNITDFLYSYTVLETKRALALENKFGDNYDKDVYGTFNDQQSPGSFSKYGDLTFETLLLTITPKVEEYTNLKLIPTYSYHRMYIEGSHLDRHRDRPSCAISATCCIGFNHDNLEDHYNWKLGVQSLNGEEFEFEMYPGDIILYRGDVLDHWRPNTFMGNNLSQVFFHYNESNDTKNYLDDRICLGVPKSEKYNRT